LANPGALTFRLTHWVVAGFLTALLSACATPSHPPAPALAATQDYNYVIGPGDSLNIIVWRNPELSMAVPVRPDGRITTPLVDELVAQGKNSIEIARDIEKLLGKFVRDPVVTVIVTNFVGPYSEQVRVIGEATRPQALPYRENMSLLDVMIATKGLTRYASGNRAEVIRRDADGKQVAIRVRLNDLIKDGDIGQNIEMQPGDTLIIPQSWF